MYHLLLQIIHGLVFRLSEALDRCQCPTDLMSLPFDPADFSYFEPRCECCFQGSCLCPLSNSTSVSNYQHTVAQMNDEEMNKTQINMLNVSQFSCQTIRLFVNFGAYKTCVNIESGVT